MLCRSICLHVMCVHILRLHTDSGAAYIILSNKHDYTCGLLRRACRVVWRVVRSPFSPSERTANKRECAHDVTKLNPLCASMCVLSLCFDVAAVVAAEFTLKNYPNVVVQAPKGERERMKRAACTSMWYTSGSLSAAAGAHSSRAIFCVRGACDLPTPELTSVGPLSLCEMPVAFGRIE